MLFRTSILALLVCAPCARGAGFQEREATEVHAGGRSHAAAARRLEECARAHGVSLEPGVVLADLRLEYVGRLEYRGDYDSPSAESVFALQGSFELSGRQAAAAHRWTTLRMGRTGSYAALVTGERAVELDLTDPEVAPRVRAVDDGSTREGVESFLPRQILRAALARRATLFALGTESVGDEECDVLGYTDDAGQARTLSISRASHLLRRYERLCPRPERGDGLEWIEFDQYELGDAGLVPKVRSEVSLDAARRVQRDLLVRAVAAEPLAPEAFALADVDLDAWPGTAPAASPAEARVRWIAQGLLTVELPASDCRVLVAELPRSLVVFEAPVDSPTAERVLDVLRAERPEKPVEYVVLSHHHAHYFGGVRAFVHAGATVVTTAGNVELLERIVGWPHTAAPDRLAREPRELKLLLVEGSRAFGDERFGFEVHDIGPGPHTREYLVSYFPAERLLWAADLARFPEDTAPQASPWMKSLHKEVRARALDVDRILQSWPLHGMRPEGSMTELETVLLSGAGDPERAEHGTGK